MAQKPSNLPLIIVAVVAGAGLIGLNAMQQANDPAIREKMDKEKQAEQAKKDAGKTKDAPQPTPAPQSAGANDVALWGAEKTWGNPDGKPAVIIGWEWTPTVQGDPSTIYGAVEAVKKSYPSAAIKAVNLDAKPGGAKPGISVDGALRVPPKVDGTFPQESMLIGALHGAPIPK